MGNIVKISDSTSTTSSNIAASLTAVKAAYDRADSASLRTKSENIITNTSQDTTTTWVNLGPGVYWFSKDGCLIDQPSTYGFVINLIYGGDVFQIWSCQNGGPMRYRQGNAAGWGNTWQNNATWADNCNWANGADASNAANTLAIAGRRVSFNWSGQGGTPDWVWGGSESTLANNQYLVYSPSNFNVNYANSAGRAYPRKTDGGDLNMNWHDHGGYPSYLWGGDDGTNMYVYPPSRLNVNYANSAWSATVTPNAVAYETADGSATLPSGGTWAYVFSRATYSGNAGVAGVAAGGTTITSGDDSKHTLFAIRVG